MNNDDPWRDYDTAQSEVQRKSGARLIGAVIWTLFLVLAFAYILFGELMWELSP